MAYSIHKAGVVGAGTMGSGIAALLAGVGIPTTLLDIPAPGTLPDSDFKARHGPALAALERLKKSRPPELFAADDLDNITVGNTEDHLDWLSDADWVVEVVVEKLDVKRALFAKLQAVARPDAILSTNTSGLPIRDIAEGMGPDFTKRFMGTHFFNPARYLRLLELIPHPDTDPAAVAAMQQFLEVRLGKGVVIAKDEPNFIGNRMMSMTLGQTINYAIDNGMTVDEIDDLTGPLLGRPQTATFRLSDLIGNDVMMHVARNLSPAIQDSDPDRDVLTHERTNAIYDHLLENGYLGNKSGQGFYKRVTADDGSKDFWPLNLQTLDYDPPQKGRFKRVGAHRKVDDVGERIKRLLGEDDRAAQFLFHHFAFYLTYASKRVPEITETLVDLDNAQKWGFAHKMGPFEIWDALGVADSLARFEGAGYTAADWVQSMLDGGAAAFYRRDANGKMTGYYSPQQGTYVPLAGDPREIKVANLKADGKIIKGNDGANIIDLGDGIALLEMTTQHMTIDQDFIEMGLQAVELVNNGDFRGLVVSHDNERFSIGANLMLVMRAVQGDQLDQLERLIKGLQDFTLAMRYANGPVVMAPFNLALGGGAEILLAGDAVVAHMELYAGLVEFGVGLIPAGGGTKEMMRRALNPVMQTKNADVLPHLQAIFEQAAFAKVSGSAKEARAMHFLNASDRIVMNRAHLLSEARRTALHMADDYTPPKPAQIYAAGHDAYAALLVAIDELVRGKDASEHDAFIARKLAYVMTGGAITEPGWVSEQYILDLERDVFMELAQTPKSLERIGHMLQTNKPLRN
jgi:3-hydroxyacyl-CoA dehydrogenase